MLEKLQRASLTPDKEIGDSAAVFAKLHELRHLVVGNFCAEARERAGDLVRYCNRAEFEPSYESANTLYEVFKNARKLHAAGDLERLLLKSIALLRASDEISDRTGLALVQSLGITALQAEENLRNAGGSAARLAALDDRLESQFSAAGRSLAMFHREYRQDRYGRLQRYAESQLLYADLVTRFGRQLLPASHNQDGLLPHALSQVLMAVTELDRSRPEDRAPEERELLARAWMTASALSSHFRHAVFTNDRQKQLDAQLNAAASFSGLAHGPYAGETLSYMSGAFSRMHGIAGLCQAKHYRRVPAEKRHYTYAIHNLRSAADQLRADFGESHPLVADALLDLAEAHFEHQDNMRFRRRDRETDFKVPYANGYHEAVNAASEAKRIGIENGVWSPLQQAKFDLWLGASELGSARRNASDPVFGYPDRSMQEVHDSGISRLESAAQSLRSVGLAGDPLAMTANRLLLQEHADAGQTLQAGHFAERLLEQSAELFGLTFALPEDRLTQFASWFKEYPDQFRAGRAIVERMRRINGRAAAA